MIRALSYASHGNLSQYPLVDRLASNLEKRVNEFEEAEVLQLLRSYEYIGNNVKFSNRLFKALNDTVVKSALANREEVTINFLINYMSSFYNLQRRKLRDVTPDQK